MWCVTPRTVRIFGYVLDNDNRGIELANVYVDGVTDNGNPIGTTTNVNGYYDLNLPMTDTVVLVYSMVGYETLRQQVFTPREVIGINVVLPTNEEMLAEVTVRGIQRQTGTMDRGDIGAARLMPDATGGGIENMLITFAGVRQNNEMSSQYNVRGGSFDENSVYVNGLEVHRPLLLRSGQQEGLSFVNPDMVESVDFSAGGFDAQYGDKMSSVLDIRYKRPTSLESHLSLSILGASGYVGWGDTVQSQMHSIRYKTSKYMLGALDTKGNYKPNFIDYQTQMTWRLPTLTRTTDGKKQYGGWSMRLLGNFSQNTYEFTPDSLSSSFGTQQQAMNKTIWYEGQEKDVFRTAFAALSAEGKITKELQIGFDLSGFYTHEQETYDISSEYVLSEQSSDGTKGTTQRGESISSEGNTGSVLGTGKYHEHARNTLQAGMITLAHNGEWKRGANTLKWGVSGQLEMISDQISEWEWRDSMGYSLPNDDKEMMLYYALKGTQKMLSGRVQGYAQDTYRWSTDHGKVLLTAGMRLNWWSLTNEVLPSPRVSVTWMPGWKQDFTFRVATGLYYQAPFYKELRQIVEDEETGVSRIQLNDKLKAQRSWQLVMGADYYFRAWGRPFKFTAEAYGKLIDRMESYTVDNVRVRYSGENDSRGYTIGLDTKLYGELVPGADTWISFSTMRSRMQFIDDKDNLGWIPTPQEQRYSLTVYFQDYIPKFPQYKVHLKFIYSEGLPFGYPRNNKMRYLGHLKDYMRLDIGASRTFSASTDKWMKKSKHVDSWGIQFEVFNLIGWKNVNSYYWVTAANGQQWASPNYLTGRMYNLKIDVNIK